jgi:hypothetical protein
VADNQRRAGEWALPGSAVVVWGHPYPSLDDPKKQAKKPVTGLEIQQTVIKIIKEGRKADAREVIKQAEKWARVQSPSSSSHGDNSAQSPTSSSSSSSSPSNQIIPKKRGLDSSSERSSKRGRNADPSDQDEKEGNEEEIFEILKHNRDGGLIKSDLAMKLLHSSSSLTRDERNLKGMGGFLEYDMGKKHGHYRVIYSVQSEWARDVVEPIQFDLFITPNWPRRVETHFLLKNPSASPASSAAAAASKDNDTRGELLLGERYENDFKLLLFDRYQNEITAANFPLQAGEVPLKFTVQFSTPSDSLLFHLDYSPLLTPLADTPYWCISNLSITPRERERKEKEVKREGKKALFSSALERKRIQLRFTWELTDAAMQEYQRETGPTSSSSLLVNDELSPLTLPFSLAPGLVRSIKKQGFRPDRYIINGSSFPAVSLTYVDSYINPSLAFPSSDSTLHTRLSLIEGKQYLPSKYRDMRPNKKDDGDYQFDEFPILIPPHLFFKDSVNGVISLLFRLSVMDNESTGALRVQERWGPYKLKLSTKEKRTERTGGGETGGTNIMEIEGKEEKGTDVIEIDTEERKEAEGDLVIKCRVGEEIPLYFTALTEGRKEITMREIKERYPPHVWEGLSIEIRGLEEIKYVNLDDLDGEGRVRGIRVPTHLGENKERKCEAVLKYTPPDDHSSSSLSPLPPDLLPLPSLSPSTNFTLIPLFGAPYRWKLELKRDIMVNMQLSYQVGESKEDSLRIYCVDYYNNKVPLPERCLLPIIQFQQNIPGQNAPKVVKWLPERDESNYFYRCPHAYCLGKSGTYFVRIISQQKNIANTEEMDPTYRYPVIRESEFEELILHPGIIHSLVPFVDGQPLSSLSLSIHSKHLIPNIYIQPRDRSGNVCVPRQSPMHLKALLPLRCELKYAAGALFYAEDMSNIDELQAERQREREKGRHNDGESDGASEGEREDREGGSEESTSDELPTHRYRYNDNNPDRQSSSAAPSRSHARKSGRGGGGSGSPYPSRVKQEFPSSPSASAPLPPSPKEASYILSSHTLSLQGEGYIHDCIGFPRFIVHVGKEGMTLQNRAKEKEEKKREEEKEREKDGVRQGEKPMEEDNQQLMRPHLCITMNNPTKNMKPLIIMLDVSPTPSVIQSLLPFYPDESFFSSFIQPAEREIFNSRFIDTLQRATFSSKLSFALVDSPLPSIHVNIQTEDGKVPPPSSLPHPSSFAVDVYQPSAPNMLLSGVYRQSVLLSAETGEYAIHPSIMLPQAPEEQMEGMGTGEGMEDTKPFFARSQEESKEGMSQPLFAASSSSSSSTSSSVSASLPSSSSSSSSVSSVMRFDHVGKWKFVVRYVEQRENILNILVGKEGTLEEHSTISVYPRAPAYLSRSSSLSTIPAAANKGGEQNRRILSSLQLYLKDSFGNVVDFNCLSPALIDALKRPVVSVLSTDSGSSPPSLLIPFSTLDQQNNCISFSQFLIKEGCEGTSGRYILYISLPPPFNSFNQSIEFDFSNDLQRIAEMQRKNEEREKTKKEMEQRLNEMHSLKQTKEGILNEMRSRRGETERVIRNHQEAVNELATVARTKCIEYRLSLDYSSFPSLLSSVKQLMQHKQEEMLKSVPVPAPVTFYRVDQPERPSYTSSMSDYLRAHNIVRGVDGYFGQLFECFTCDAVEDARLILFHLGSKARWHIFESDTCTAALRAKELMKSDQFLRECPSYQSQFIYLSPSLPLRADYSNPPSHAEKCKISMPRYAANSLRVQALSSHEMKEEEWREYEKAMRNILQRVLGRLIIVDSEEAYREYANILLSNKPSVPPPAALILRERSIRTEYNSEPVGALSSPPELNQIRPRFAVVPSLLLDQLHLLREMAERGKILQKREGEVFAAAQQLKDKQKEEKELETQLLALQEEIKNLYANYVSLYPHQSSATAKTRERRKL